MRMENAIDICLGLFVVVGIVLTTLLWRPPASRPASVGKFVLRAGPVGLRSARMEPAQ